MCFAPMWPDEPRTALLALGGDGDLGMAVLYLASSRGMFNFNSAHWMSMTQYISLVQLNVFNTNVLNILIPKIYPS